MNMDKTVEKESRDYKRKDRVPSRATPQMVSWPAALPPEVLTAIRNSTWVDPEEREEQIAIILEGAGLDPATKIP